MDKPKTKKSIFKIISDVIFTLVMVFMGTVVVFSIIEKTTGISISGYHLVWVKTESMEPTIEKSSYIITKNINGNDVKEGDVVTFLVKDTSSPIYGQYNTHRVIGIDENNKLITKGDNNLVPDSYHVDRTNVTAKYQRNVPFLTFFGRLFASTAGYVITILLIALFVGIWFAIDIRDKKKAKKEELMKEMVAKEVERLELEEKKKKGK